MKTYLYQSNTRTQLQNGETSQVPSESRRAWTSAKSKDCWVRFLGRPDLGALSLKSWFRIKQTRASKSPGKKLCLLSKPVQHLKTSFFTPLNLSDPEIYYSIYIQHIQRNTHTYIYVTKMGDRDSKGLRFLYMFEIVQASKKKRNNLQTKKAETLRKRGREALWLYVFCLLSKPNREMLRSSRKQRRAMTASASVSTKNNHFLFSLKKKMKFPFSCWVKLLSPYFVTPKKCLPNFLWEMQWLTESTQNIPNWINCFWNLK